MSASNATSERSYSAYQGTLQGASAASNHSKDCTDGLTVVDVPNDFVGSQEACIWYQVQSSDQLCLKVMGCSLGHVPRSKCDNLQWSIAPDCG